MKVQNLLPAYQEFSQFDGFILRAYCIFFVKLKVSIDIIISDLTCLYLVSLNWAG